MDEKLQRMGRMNVATPIPITRHDGIVVEVSVFRLLQWQSCIKLEQKGLRHSQGSVFKAAWDQLIGTPAPRATTARRRAVLDIIDNLLAQIRGEA